MQVITVPLEYAAHYKHLAEADESAARSRRIRKLS